MADKTKPVAWARVLPAFKPPHSKGLRAGTWYQVVRDQLPDRVSLLVGKRTQDVPRRVLEIKKRRPSSFSVVYGKGDLSARGYAAFDGRERYVVCPECLDRFPMPGHPPKTICPRCGYHADIGWDE
jgi:hypothetical protein